MEIGYTTMDGIPGQYFFCAAYQATIAVSRCACMYKASKKIRVGEYHTLQKCIGCKIGALHAGEQPIVMRSGNLPRHMCVRCHCYADRLLSNGVCVSCSNRAAEVKKGRNAKGCTPSPSDWFWRRPEQIKGKGKTVWLYPVRLTTKQGSDVRYQVIDDASNTLEAMLRILRLEREEIVFGRRPAIKVDTVQMSLFGGLH
ncbi:hypothetical protein [Oxalobacter paraformigenes]|uniref:Uncharacterized protein n=1 Tax=Oxalobacter paraformigenes TaxID=556268 RepID=T5LE78_9BURK|nr:hypothetical protein [Oxalobacter paraformigenes]EQM95171.1 hypothetical protein OFAG_02267 [Oxalobacter paraformigenes]